MADKDKIKNILRRSVKPGKYLTEAQISEIADKLIVNRSISEGLVKNASNEVVRDSEALSLNAIDMTTINDELKK